MKNTALILLLALSSSAFAAETKAPAAPAAAKAETKDDLTLIKAADLKKMTADKKAAVYVFDANDDQTRAKEGMIPGAVKLKSNRDYDLAVLPADKNAQVVFYCGGPLCMASHEAAHRAVKAGYAKVTVMSDGITGWKKAGFETAKATN